MDPYSFIRPILFRFAPENAHHLSLDSLSFLHRHQLLSPFIHQPSSVPTNLCGLQLDNPVGLAAGLDKDGKYIDALAALGFGFLEIGTVTPRPQAGNPLPRMFRLTKSKAIINRMGFNNDGVEACIKRVEASSFYQEGGILGLNIGKNATTPIEEAHTDYVIGLRSVYPYASYITINISSPNTKNLRQLQSNNQLYFLLEQISIEREKLIQQFGKRTPIFLKIAPDLNLEEIDTIAQYIEQFQIDALIATNTTISRDKIAGEKQQAEAGGLSGEPLSELSNKIIKQFHHLLHGKIPIIGVGGIMTGTDALEKKLAGANVIQLYSGLIYRGPHLIQECISAMDPN
ncbi:quinone-dependent dihydroorotate dehydrogenase [Polynucleobacter kasalickyi]|uniref:Dihydroorotate dehydrogenase (quinone) n=1 Tax=Polynucleobacter kasalickyi TaxID=1938817 RepID=A0A1W2B2N3_9BURK|nr:quinone-dependent dihydroorotate dehydrogenase [Polynucleobacter kasalickyi]SMC66962.1 dihydroorotate oxidase A [Polynucleobacter kasalickyi]